MSGKSDDKKEKKNTIKNTFAAVKAVTEKPAFKKTVSFLKDVYGFATLSNKDKLEFILDLAQTLTKDRKEREETKELSDDEIQRIEDKEKRKAERRLRRKVRREKLQDLKKVVIGTVVSYIAVLEPLTKKACYCLCPCDLYPKVPDDLIDTGINIPLSKLDFFCMFSTDPDSNEGRLMYNDITPTLNKDVNVELYKTINSSNGEGGWKELLTFKYIEEGAYTYPGAHPTSLIANDVWELDIINVKIHPDWKNKSMNLFMGDLITSFQILKLKQLFADSLDILFNSLSKRDASTECLKNKEAAMAFTDKINNEIDDENELEIDDSFFEFSSAELLGLEENIEKRKRGIMTFTDCETTEVKVDFNEMEGIVLEFEECATEKEQINVMSDSFTYMIENSDGFRNRGNSIVDAIGEQFKIILAFLKALIKAITLQFLAPRMVLFFHIYLYVTSPNDKFKKYLDSKENQHNKPPIVFLLQLIKRPLKHLIKKVIFAFFISLIMQKLVIPKIKTLLSNYVAKLKKEKRDNDNFLVRALKDGLTKMVDKA